ncbi:acyl carrier protein [Chloroflexi bacterium TSY]|nr:acyl carrier protein [Chloroflexi bacterium TSY]
MQVREVILNHLAAVVEEHSPLPFPDDVDDDMQLNEFWLDSVALVELVTAIEKEIGFIPTEILHGIAFPKTIGELITAYENE